MKRSQTLDIVPPHENGPQTLDIVPPHENWPTNSEHCATHAGMVLVGLNPTLEAVTQKAVFCNNNAFWNLLIKANVLHESILEIERKTEPEPHLKSKITPHVEWGLPICYL
jgi:hypothetical protein